jgi:hypothetical protein
MGEYFVTTSTLTFSEKVCKPFGKRRNLLGKKIATF